MRRVIVTLHLPLDMGSVGRIVSAVAAEFPGATVGVGIDEMPIIADDGVTLPEPDPPAEPGGWTVRRLGDWEALDPTTRAQADEDRVELDAIDLDRLYASNVTLRSGRSWRYVGPGQLAQVKPDPWWRRFRR